MPLDFEEIRKNADEQGISLTEIAIVYEGLSAEQVRGLKDHELLVENLADGSCLGRFASDGSVLYPELATRVLTLGA